MKKIILMFLLVLMVLLVGCDFGYEIKEFIVYKDEFSSLEYTDEAKLYYYDGRQDFMNEYTIFDKYNKNYFKKNSLIIVSIIDNENNEYEDNQIFNGTISIYRLRNKEGAKKKITLILEIVGRDKDIVNYYVRFIDKNNQIENYEHTLCEQCGKCVSNECNGLEEEKCLGHENNLQNYFDNTPNFMQIKLTSEYDFKFDKEVIIESNNKNISTINPGKIIGVSKGQSIITILLKEDQSIKKEIGIEVIDDYVDPFPNIPNYIELPLNQEYTFVTDEDINIEFRYDISVEGENYFHKTSSKSIKALLNGSIWVEITSVSDPLKKKIVYIVCSLNKKYNIENGAYETYTFYYKNQQCLPKYLDEKSDFSTYFIKDKAEMFEIFKSGTIYYLDTVPRNLVNLTLDEYWVLVTYHTRGYGSTLGYSQITYNNLTRKINIAIESIGSSAVDASEVFIDIILIPRDEIPNNLNIENINDYDIVLCNLRDHEHTLCLKCGLCISKMCDGLNENKCNGHLEHVYIPCMDCLKCIENGCDGYDHERCLCYEDVYKDVQFIDTGIDESLLGVANVIKTKEDLDEYFNKNKEKYEFSKEEDNPNLYPLISFEEAIEKYNKEYFNNKNLVILMTYGSRVETRHVIRKIDIVDGAMKIYLETKQSAGGSDGINSWQILIEIDKCEYDQIIVYKDGKNLTNHIHVPCEICGKCLSEECNDVQEVQCQGCIKVTLSQKTYVSHLNSGEMFIGPKCFLINTYKEYINFVNENSLMEIQFGEYSGGYFSNYYDDLYFIAFDDYDEKYFEQNSLILICLNDVYKRTNPGIVYAVEYENQLLKVHASICTDNHTTNFKGKVFHFIEVSKFVISDCQDIEYMLDKFIILD